MLPVSLLLINRSKVLLFSVNLDGFHFKEMCCSSYLNPNIFAIDFEYLIFFVPLLLYHRFSIFIPNKLNFLQCVRVKDMVYDNLVFDFTLFGNSS